MKKLNKLLNVIHYVVGYYRYYLYYNAPSFIRNHIKKQIEFRIQVMFKPCYDNGECVFCGCSTTALQMANKSCDKPCYPPMLNKKKAFSFLKGNPIVYKNTTWSQKKSKVDSVYYTEIFKNKKRVHIELIKDENN